MKIAPTALREAFLWEEQRTVDKTGCFSRYGNGYEVDVTLAKRKVTVRASASGRASAASKRSRYTGPKAIGRLLEGDLEIPG